jgi:dsDNA-binding SOS-regulon protein
MMDNNITVSAELVYGVLEELHALLVSRTNVENCLIWATKEPDLAAKYLALASVYVNTVNKSNTPVNKNQDIELSVFLDEMNLLNQCKKF